VGRLGWFSFLLTGLLLSSCKAVGPDYKRPDVGAAPSFVETGPWKAAAPQDAISRGEWWQIFEDETLSGLERQAVSGNLGLKAAASRVQQAQAAAGIAGTFLYPELNLGAGAARFGVSGNRPDQPNKVPFNQRYVANDFRVPLYASYEVDLWGRIRRITESADAQAQASVAAFYTVLLTLQGDVAQTYFLLRASDEELRILRANIDLRRQGLELVAARRRGGLSSDLDVARAETELAATQAEAEATLRRRSDLQYRLSVLIGAAPERFRLEEGPFNFKVPAVPVGLPSDLLERRPDIAEAERHLVARNAEIGVAKSAYFPAVRLTGAAGFESSDLGDLLKRDSTIWGFGASLWQPIFNAGRIGFDVERARAAYAENLSGYQERVLRAFQEVETSLAGLRILSQQSEFQSKAQSSAETATRLATARYRAGVVGLFEVIDAERTSLFAQRQTLQLVNDQLLTTVALVKALGGGWDARAGLALGATGDPSKTAAN
jgi:outer membrane protein, multidrug efflux system